jgi:hypothetical protein
MSPSIKTALPIMAHMVLLLRLPLVHSLVLRLQPNITVSPLLFSPSTIEENKALVTSTRTMKLPPKLRHQSTSSPCAQSILSWTPKLALPLLPPSSHHIDYAPPMPSSTVTNMTCSSLYRDPYRLQHCHRCHVLYHQESVQPS